MDEMTIVNPKTGEDRFQIHSDGQVEELDAVKKRKKQEKKEEDSNERTDAQ